MTNQRSRHDDAPANEHSDTDGRLSRRNFVKVAGAGALVGAAATTAASGQSAASGFVETDGPRLVIDGEQVYFHGANNFWITDSFRGEQPRIDELFGMFDEMGLNLVRTFVACEGGDGDCYIPEPGVHNEGAYETLDYIIAAAADHDIRLVLVLADNWDHNGGIAQYISWIDSASAHVDFFRNEDVKSLYRWHVEDTLTRTNTITGREYREEPSIMAWELCNEPRIEGDDYGDAADPGNEQRAQVLEDWIAEMSGFVKSIDPNHLISTGMEGFYTRPDRTSWFYSDWTGQDYVRHHSIDDVDLCTFHMYPYHWNFPLEYGKTWIREHVRDAHEEIGKPAYLGEFNVNVQDHTLETKNQFLGEWYDVMAAYDCNAASIWQIVTPDMHDHDGFQVYRSESGDVLNTYRQAVVSKSGAPLVTDGSTPGLQAPASVVAETTASSIEAHWSSVLAATEYAVYLDGALATTTQATSATIGGLAGNSDYEVGVAAIGAGGSESAATTITATTVDGSNVGYPQWEYGTVFESGDRAVHNGIVWEAQWYTDQEEPRFESGYAWVFVRVVGEPADVTGDGTATPPSTETPTGTETPAPTETPTDGIALDGSTARDIDGDGLYQDLNGNGRMDNDDVVTYFEQMNSAGISNNTAAFDYNGNGRIDFDDVVTLFEAL